MTAAFVCRISVQCRHIHCCDCMQCRRQPLRRHFSLSLGSFSFSNLPSLCYRLRLTNDWSRWFKFFFDSNIIMILLTSSSTFLPLMLSADETGWRSTISRATDCNTDRCACLVWRNVTGCTACMTDEFMDMYSWWYCTSVQTLKKVWMNNLNQSSFWSTTGQIDKFLICWTKHIFDTKSNLTHWTAWRHEN